MSNTEPVDPFTRMAVGQSDEMSRTVTDTDIVLYAAVTGDMNPMHLDADHASRSQFGERIAHGMLTAGFISATLALHLPGPGAVFITQSLRFVRPVRIGDTITTRVEILELFPSRRRIRLSTVCRNQRNELVLDGEAVTMLPKPV